MADCRDRAGFGPPSSEDDWVSEQAEAMAAAWRRGEALTAAELMARRPELGTEDAIRLIYEEACLRREAGLPVDTSEVVARFPRWGEALRRLFDCDRLLRPSGQGQPGAYPEVGEALGPFFLLAELGRGASGRTFLATDPTLADRPVVLKVVSDDQEEHLALAQLRHTHIVPLFSEHALVERGLRVLCMPYLGGTSLAAILEDLADGPPEARSGRRLVEAIDRKTRDGPLPILADGPFRRGLEGASYVQAMTWIAACLADALQYAHARGLVHMDLKPSNVLLTADGQPMLLDFHLARGPIQAGEWVAGRLGGTPGWMSPEQQAALRAAREGRPAPAAVDGRSDIYSLGLLLREALGLPAGPPRERRAGVSVALADLVRKCLADDPGGRYADAASLAADLRRELGDLPLRGVRNRSLSERWRKWRRRNPGALAWAVAGASLLVIALAAIAGGSVSFRQRVDQAQAALDEGRYERASGRFADAVRTLERARKTATGLPWVAGLTSNIDEELRRARRGQIAAELHDLADRVRFQYGIELPSREEAGALLRDGKALWERRARILPSPAGPTLDPAAEERVRTDLLEIAMIWTEMRLSLAVPDGVEAARRDVLRTLDEADQTFGPRSSYAIGVRRARVLAGSPSDPASARPIPGEPRSAWEHYDRGREHLREGRLEEALQEFRRTLEEHPQDFWPNFYEGLCAFRLKQYEPALAAFRACIALRPDEAAGYYNRALAHAALGRPEAARRDYDLALQHDPGLAVALLNRGILSYREGQLRPAIADFQRGLRSRADRETLSRLHYNLALARRASGEVQAALGHAEQAIALGSTEAVRLRGELQRAPH